MRSRWERPLISRLDSAAIFVETRLARMLITAWFNGDNGREITAMSRR